MMSKGLVLSESNEPTVKAWTRDGVTVKIEIELDLIKGPDTSELFKEDFESIVDGEIMSALGY